MTKSVCMFHTFWLLPGDMIINGDVSITHSQVLY